MSAPDLRRYIAPVEGPLAFVREQIVLADGRTVGDAMASDPWVERDLLRPVFEVDTDGLPAHRLVYLELPRGHWKSGGAAAVAITEGLLSASTDVVVAAADRDQASIVTENMRGYLARNPLLRRSFVVRKDELEVPARGSRVRTIAADSVTAWGLGGTHRRFRVVLDELSVWKQSGEDLWTALVSATGKVRDTQVLVISNAGFGAERSWQWRVRETAAREPWGYLYSAPGVIASWVGDEWLRQMRALLPGAAFERAILNRWVSEAGDFVTRDQWRRCVEPGLRVQTAGVYGVTYFGGLDLGLTRDRTAFAVVHLDRAQNVVLDDLLVWEGSRSSPVEIAGIERAMVDAQRRFPGIRVLADPWQLKGSIARLRGEGVRIDEHVFSAGSIAKLSAILYEAVSDASLRVFDDDDLEREVLGMAVVQTPGGWRIDHRAGGYSDRVVALAMAVQQAVASRRPDRSALASDDVVDREGMARSRDASKNRADYRLKIDYELRRSGGSSPWTRLRDADPGWSEIRAF